MFLHVPVILFTEGVCLPTMPCVFQTPLRRRKNTFSDILQTVPNEFIFEKDYFTNYYCLNLDNFRLCFDDKQHSTGANARAQIDSQDAGSELAQSTSAPIEAATRSTHQSNGGSTSRMSRQFRWMGQDAPAFRVRGEDVDVLPSPSAFYDTLKVSDPHSLKENLSFQATAL